MKETIKCAIRQKELAALPPAATVELIAKAKSQMAEEIRKPKEFIPSEIALIEKGEITDIVASPLKQISESPSMKESTVLVECKDPAAMDHDQAERTGLTSSKELEIWWCTMLLIAWWYSKNSKRDIFLYLDLQWMME